MSTLTRTIDTTLTEIKIFRDVTPRYETLAEVDVENALREIRGEPYRDTRHLSFLPGPFFSFDAPDDWRSDLYALTESSSPITKHRFVGGGSYVTIDHDGVSREFTAAELAAIIIDPDRAGELGLRLVNGSFVYELGLRQAAAEAAAAKAEAESREAERQALEADRIKREDCRAHDAARTPAAGEFVLFHQKEIILGGVNAAMDPIVTFPALVVAAGRQYENNKLIAHLWVFNRQAPAFRADVPFSGATAKEGCWSHRPGDVAKVED